MSDEHSRDPGERLPWGFVLDPAANARALGDVQRRGLEAARELVERVASTLNPPGGDPVARPSPARSTNGQNPVVGDLVQGWWEVAGRVLTELAGTPDPPPGRPAPEGRAEVDVNSGDRPAVWRIQAEPDGSLIGSGELWLRNPQPSPVGPLRLGVGDLRTPAGTLISSGCVVFEPAEAAELPARSARGFVVSLDVENPLEPGAYRGVVQAEGAPRLWVPVELTVAGGPP